MDRPPRRTTPNRPILTDTFGLCPTFPEHGPLIDLHYCPHAEHDRYGPTLKGPGDPAKAKNRWTLDEIENAVRLDEPDMAPERRT